MQLSLLLLSAACIESQVVLRDAGAADDSGRELEDAAAKDAAASECPSSAPSSGASCQGTAACQWNADCLDTRRPGTALIQVRVTSQCVDGKWRTETPAICFAGGQDADGGDE
ncbi:MAG TPA: hypothetical protein VJR89_15595 [Polyangiales bacterium]|nr:hypothetical protein [Polyangiales bacterium]